MHPMMIVDNAPRAGNSNAFRVPLYVVPLPVPFPQSFYSDGRLNLMS